MRKDRLRIPPESFHLHSLNSNDLLLLPSIHLSSLYDHKVAGAYPATFGCTQDSLAVHRRTPSFFSCVSVNTVWDKLGVLTLKNHTPHISVGKQAGVTSAERVWIAKLSSTGVASALLLRNTNKISIKIESSLEKKSLFFYTKIVSSSDGYAVTPLTPRADDILFLPLDSPPPPLIWPHRHHV